MTKIADRPDASNLLLGLEEIEWTPSTPAPPELSVNNMRRRGIDQYQIAIPTANDPGPRRGLFGLGLLGNRKPQIAAITIVENRLRFEVVGSGNVAAREIDVACMDVDTIVVRPASRTSEASLLISYGNTNPAVEAGLLEIGIGLPEETLKWLRDRLLLETAGLVSKPLYNVGRRTTRQTINPDDEQYMHWPSGSNRLIELFLEEAPGRVSSFKVASEDQRWQDAASHVHWLKSSSAAVGAGQLSELCQRLEIEIDNKDPLRIGTLSSHLLTEFQRVRDCLDRIASGVMAAAAAADDTEPAKPLSPAEQPLRGRKVLLVEDSLVNQELARDTLELLGCEVTAAKSGEAAIAEYASTRFDLILMDCQMPGMGGMEATRIIRNAELNHIGRKTPIIALTAHALRDDRSRCLAAGMNDHLGKPYKPEELAEMLRKWLPASTTTASTPGDAEIAEAVE